MNAFTLKNETSQAESAAVHWRRRKLTALVVALVALAITALVNACFGVQHLAALTLCLFVTLLFYASTRLIQTRGQLTTALVAIVLPAIVALLCVTLSRMTPFLNRQLIMSQMSDAGIRFSARQPDEVDEWLRDREGYMLPTWLAFCIGAHSMTCLGEIAGDVHAISKLPLERVPTSSLRRLELRVSRENSLSPEVVDWLNELPARRPNDELDILFFFSTIGEEDQKQLARLKRPWTGQLELKGPNVQLRELGFPQGLTVRADRLTVEQTKVIARSTPDWLIITSDLSPAVVRELDGQAVRFEACQIDAKTLEAIAHLDTPSYYFSAIFSDLSVLEPLKPSPKPRHLFLTSCQFQSSDDHLRIAEYLNCSHLSLLNGAAGPSSAAQIDVLWKKCPQLESFSEWTGTWTHYERPGVKK